LRERGTVPEHVDVGVQVGVSMDGDRVWRWAGERIDGGQFNVPWKMDQARTGENLRWVPCSM